MDPLQETGGRVNSDRRPGQTIESVDFRGGKLTAAELKSLASSSELKSTKKCLSHYETENYRDLPIQADAA
jgi:hypothetical protein